MECVWSDIKASGPKTPEKFVTILRKHVPSINSSKVLQWENHVTHPWEKKICLFLYFYLVAERYTNHEGEKKEQFLNDLQLRIQSLWSEVQEIMVQQSSEDAFAGLADAFAGLSV